jgi:putative membrane protein
MNIIISWLLSALAIYISAYILPGIVVAGAVAALVLAVVLGVINTFIRPILVVLTLPLTVVTFGLFSLVLNTLLIMVAGMVVPGVEIASFWWALLFGVVLALVSALLRSLERRV